jgi:hypothetical protein
MNELVIENASVKVMRSYDYCHFEVALSSNSVVTAADVDELRKMAARLADKAVEQYKVAKKNAEKRTSLQFERQCLEQKIDLIRKIEPGNRTVNQLAQLKSYEDEGFQAKGYNYEDDWEED